MIHSSSSRAVHHQGRDWRRNIIIASIELQYIQVTHMYGEKIETQFPLIDFVKESIVVMIQLIFIG